MRLAARAAAHQDRDQAAIAIYCRLILEDMDAEDLYLLGRALRRTGQVELAVKTYERARLVNPDHPEALEALARLYLKEDRENAAEFVYVRRHGTNEGRYAGSYSPEQLRGDADRIRKSDWKWSTFRLRCRDSNATSTE